ncbi:polymer-forming cytoskeletal protein [Alicyclobacillus herbarius]|uniref:polymer-forming cytoskeletal protein n=1 Tax=Alicyclobacillus herbarius TaxID=122960 RepID=UPI00047CF74A|nr:polymer-forming cytoskeletal protein [Alicyclobacillus herbarius]
MNPQGSDLVIHGIGSSSGGVFRNVTVHGTARIAGDITCERWDAHGTCKVMGDVRARKLAAHGTLRCHGDVTAQEVGVHGTASVDGKLEGHLLGVHGRLTVSGQTQAERVNVEGILRAETDIQAEQMRVKGCLRVAGLLNVGALELTMYGPSQVEELGGDRVVVRGEPTAGWLRWLLWRFQRHRLDAGVIEGDDVRLEQTTARVVRGHRVHIGKGCVIGLVEYTGTLSKSPNARIDEERKVGPTDA